MTVKAERARCSSCKVKTTNRSTNDSLAASAAPTCCIHRNVNMHVHGMIAPFKNCATAFRQNSLCAICRFTIIAACSSSARTCFSFDVCWFNSTRFRSLKTSIRKALIAFCFCCPWFCRRQRIGCSIPLDHALCINMIPPAMREHFHEKMITRVPPRTTIMVFKLRLGSEFSRYASTTSSFWNIPSFCDGGQWESCRIASRI
mmetsp:Transcript_22492/g.45501  ORF Transcript_22492/g.45501 Transcript_22492/m.45501 type:complete len:202 (-) Transcript_22492:225-830(-)